MIKALKMWDILRDGKAGDRFELISGPDCVKGRICSMVDSGTGQKALVWENRKHNTLVELSSSAVEGDWKKLPPVLPPSDYYLALTYLDCEESPLFYEESREGYQRQPVKMSPIILDSKGSPHMYNLNKVEFRVDFAPSSGWNLVLLDSRQNVIGVKKMDSQCRPYQMVPYVASSVTLTVEPGQLAFYIKDMIK